MAYCSTTVQLAMIPVFSQLHLPSVTQNMFVMTNEAYSYLMVNISYMLISYMLISYDRAKLKKIGKFYVLK